MVQKTPARPRRRVITLRIGDIERRLIETAAAQRGMPPSRYLRETALAAARDELSRPPDEQ